MLLRINFIDSSGVKRWGFFCRIRAKGGIVVLANPFMGLYKSKPKKYRSFDIASEETKVIAQALNCSKTVVFSSQEGEETVSVWQVSQIGTVNL